MTYEQEEKGQGRTKHISDCLKAYKDLRAKSISAWVSGVFSDRDFTSILSALNSIERTLDEAEADT